MKKIILLTEHYPSPSNIYNYMFIHSRAIEYIKRGFDVRVLYLSNKEEKYQYEGVSVYKGDFSTYKECFILYKADVIFIHSPKEKIITEIVNIKSSLKIPSYTWIHGVEALSVYRRVFNVKNKSDFFRLYTKGLFIELRRKLLFRKYKKIIDKYGDSFVFVSNWMKDITEKDNLIKFNNFRVIPNFIDSKLFDCNVERNNKSFLIVRSFESKKYANDISMEIINRLFLKRNDFNVTIFGDGCLFEKEISKLNLPSSMLNVNKKMLDRNELSNILNNHNYGYFLCPTRQDAQGVTMCEAMSSKLIAITNPSTAIPEFVSIDYAVIDDDLDNIVNYISKLMDNKKEFNDKAFKSRDYIVSTLSSDICISKELELF